MLNSTEINPSSLICISFYQRRSQHDFDILGSWFCFIMFLGHYRLLNLNILQLCHVFCLRVFHNKDSTIQAPPTNSLSTFCREGPCWELHLASCVRTWVDNVEPESCCLNVGAGNKVSTCLTEIPTRARRQPHQTLGQRCWVFDGKALSRKTILIAQGFKWWRIPSPTDFLGGGSLKDLCWGADCKIPEQKDEHSYIWSAQC